MPVFNPYILNPISDESSCGNDMQGTELFEQLEEAYEENLDLDEPVVRNWHEVIRIANILLTERTKDLYVLERLMEASVYKDGIVGCFEALKICRDFLESFWDDLHPNPQISDYLMIRTNLLRRFDKYCEVELSRVPLIPAGQSGYSYADYVKSTRLFVISPDAYESERTAIQEKAKKAGTVDSLTWQFAIQKVSTDYFEKMLSIINQCSQIRYSLEDRLDERIPKNDFAFTNLRISLDQIRDFFQRQIPVRPMPAAATAVENEPTVPTFTPSPRDQRLFSQEVVSNLDEVSIDLSILDSRSKAFQLIETVALFFEKCEPHSPVGPTLRRAIYLGNLSLVELLEDITPDESTRNLIFKYFSIAGAKNQVG